MGTRDWGLEVGNSPVPTKVLYIAGYGRSGSTVLGAVLGSHPDVAFVGEIAYLLDDWADPDRRCSCGKAYPQCDFWGGLFSEWNPPPKMAEVTRGVERHPFRLLIASRSSQSMDYRLYRDRQSALLKQICSHSGKSIVLDSSKSARLAVGRFFALSRIAGQDVYVLHLVRDGRASMRSLLIKGSNWAMEGSSRAANPSGIRSVLGWVRANMWTTVLGRILGRHRYMRVRYEDFLANPASVLQRIGEFAGFDTENLIERINMNQDFTADHVVGGNRIRFEQAIQIKRMDTALPGERLRLRHRLAFALFGGWLNRLYGYHA